MDTMHLQEESEDDAEMSPLGGMKFIGCFAANYEMNSCMGELYGLSLVP